MVWSVFFHYSQGKGDNIKVRNGLIVSFKACKSIILGITNGTQKKLILILLQNNDDAFLWILYTRIDFSK